ncbi:MAG: DUF1329 domain-containing protein [Candidatus Binataceae bacterium]
MHATGRSWAGLTAIAIAIALWTVPARAQVPFQPSVAPASSSSRPLGTGQVKPGDKISAVNAAQAKELLSPGTYYAATKGMEIDVVAPHRIDWPPPYQDATEKYSAQVRLSPDHRSLVGYVAGQPFPLLDPNDPDVATKIMWNSSFRPIATDDGDLRFFECLTQYFKPGGTGSALNYVEIGHLAGYSNLGRTEVEPLPIDPDFKQSGVWFRSAGYPVIAPDESRGDGLLRYRYWEADRADDAWTYLAQSRRVRRLNEVIMGSSPGFSTWDFDHSGGFGAKSQEYNYKFLGARDMLACVNAVHSPAQPCPSDGRVTSCPEDWEIRHLYMVEATPRSERISGALQSRTLVYVDSEMWFNPYVDSYDRHGQLWKTQIYWLTYRDRPVPDARVAIYPFKREFVTAASSVDVQSGLATTCYFPGHETPERECWYINMGAVRSDFFTREAMVRAGH